MKQLTEIIFILDKSGSMSGLEKDTIGGFNTMLNKQKQAEGDAFITTVLFDNEHHTIHDRLNIKEVNELTNNDYFASGSTALLDALGDTIKHIKKIHKYIRKEDIPNKTIFVITTDGEENASHRYSSDKIKQMINQQKKDGWEFIFLGANIDAIETAKTYGIDQEYAVNYEYTAGGTKNLYACVDEAITQVRSNHKIKANWKDNINHK